jgi:selenocysteine lyase/cysteine desulfurase
MYIRKSKLEETDLCLGNREDPADSIDSRVNSGTYNFAATLTIPVAIDFHNYLTADRKQARLQFLRNYWVSRVRDIDGMEILTRDDPARYGATTSFRLKGMRTFEQAKKVQDLLLAKYKVLTVARKGDHEWGRRSSDTSAVQHDCGTRYARRCTQERAGGT